jgi:hypothetical protein
MTTSTITMEPITGRQFCWFEVNTRNAEACGAFYGELLGWSQNPQSMGGMTYTLFEVAGTPVGGMMTMNEMWPAEVPAHWMSYVAVDDIDAYAASVPECGGSLCVPVTEIPPGKFCVVTDPTGAVFSLFQGGDGLNPVGDRTFGWCELATTDVEKAKEFYSKLLDWTFDDATEVTGDPYWFIKAGESSIGGLLKMPEPWGEGHRSCWTPCVQVDDLDAVTAKAKEMGAHIYAQPTDVGNIVRYSCIQDPEGAVLSLYRALQPSCGSDCGCSG